MANPKEACILLYTNQGLNIFVNTEVIVKQDGTEQSKSYDLKFFKFLFLSFNRIMTLVGDGQEDLGN